MPTPNPHAAPGTRPHLIPRCIDGKFWMLYHRSFEQVLDDFGWFQSQREAEAKIAELERIFAPRRSTSLAPDPDANN